MGHCTPPVEQRLSGGTERRDEQAARLSLEAQVLFEIHERIGLGT